MGFLTTGEAMFAHAICEVQQGSAGNGCTVDHGKGICSCGNQLVRNQHKRHKPISGLGHALAWDRYKGQHQRATRLESIDKAR